MWIRTQCEHSYLFPFFIFAFFPVALLLGGVVVFYFYLACRRTRMIWWCINLLWHLLWERTNAHKKRELLLPPIREREKMSSDKQNYYLSALHWDHFNFPAHWQSECATESKGMTMIMVAASAPKPKRKYCVLFDMSNTPKICAVRCSSFRTDSRLTRNVLMCSFYFVSAILATQRRHVPCKPNAENDKHALLLLLLDQQQQHTESNDEEKK